MPDIPFPTDQCPICNKSLIFDEPQNTYYCTVGVDDQYPNDWMPHSHYVVFATKPTEQSVLLGGFLFATRANHPNETNISFQEGDDIMYLPRITDWSNPEKLVAKIKTLLLFS